MNSITLLTSGEVSASNFDLCNAATPEFVNLDQKKYYCIKCKKLLRNPQQIKCGHRICQACVKACFAEVQARPNDGSQKKICCPGSDDEACDEMTENEVFPDFSAVREMKLLMVFCRYKKYGCAETMQWSKLDTHSQKCPHRLKVCEFCHVEQHVDRYEIHIKEECSHYPCKCPYGCKDSSLTRSKLESHSKRCSMKPKTCKFDKMGCTFKSAGDQMSVHEADHSLHLDIVVQYCHKLEDDITSLEQRVKQTEAELRSHMSLLEKGATEIKALETKINELEADIKRSNERQTSIISKQDKKFVSLEAQLKAMEKVTQEMSLIRIRQNQQDTMIAEFNAKSPARTLTLPEDVRQKFIMHDRTIGLHDIRLSEIDIRCQCLENTNYDGLTIWKINEYRHRKEEAKNGRHISLYSQPFYTSRYGYKMCGRVYINGDGAGRGTHLSLFFVIMRGEYDDILPWPYRQKVTLMVMDQQNNRAHLTDYFRPDPTSNSFQKPTTAMNVASGCPLFVAHSVLENPNGVFLKNDTIYLKIAVEQPPEIGKP